MDQHEKKIRFADPKLSARRVDVKQARDNQVGTTQTTRSGFVQNFLREGRIVLVQREMEFPCRG